jgi:hypothetical protein
MSSQQPSEEEMRAALEEQMRRITVQDVLVQTVVTLINLGGRRLGLAGPPEEAGERDLEQARLAIEGARALVPLLPQEADLGPVRDALSQLQMAYVQLSQAEAQPQAGTAAGEGEPGEGASDPGAAASGASQPPPGEPTSGASQPPSQPTPSPADEAERAKARSKIWTPPGS